MTISFNVDVAGGWFSPAGELRRHAQLLIGDRCIVEFINQFPSLHGQSQCLAIASGVFLQSILIEQRTIPLQLFIKMGVVDASGSSLRIAYSVQVDQHSPHFSLCLLGVQAGEERLDMRRTLRQLGKDSHISWKTADQDILARLFPYVPLAHQGARRKQSIWTSLCQPEEF